MNLPRTTDAWKTAMVCTIAAEGEVVRIWDYETGMHRQAVAHRYMEPSENIGLLWPHDEKRCKDALCYTEPRIERIDSGPIP